MSTITPQSMASAPNGEQPLVHHRFSVEDYHAMGRAGILGPEDRVELLEGCIVKKMNLNPPHIVTVHICQQSLAEVLPEGWHLRMQGPITSGDSEPEPDLLVARGELRDYLQVHPAGDHVALAIEVADSSLARDRLKRAIYGRANVPVYWIVNLNETQVEVYTDPTGPAEEAGYRTERVYKPGQQVPLLIDGNEIAKIEVKDLLP